MESPLGIAVDGRTPDAGTLIALCDVSLRFEEQNLALQDVHLEICRGEYAFLVGQTGSGKSSLLRMLIAELRPTSGSVWIDGRDVAELTPREIPGHRRRIGFVFQDFRLLPDRTLEENVAFALRVIGIHGREMVHRTQDALARVGLLDKRRMFPHQVSGGEQQRTAVARAIVNRPMLLLADEPTGNLDPQTSMEIMDLLTEINRLGTTVLVATHDQPVVDSLRKRVIQLDCGRIVRDEAEGRYSTNGEAVAAAAEALSA